MTATSIPTASQNDADAHEIALSCGVPEGRDCCDQTDPLYDRAATVDVEILYATASQDVADTHEMSVIGGVPDGSAPESSIQPELPLVVV